MKQGNGWALPRSLFRPLPGLLPRLGWMGWRSRPLGAVAPVGGRRPVVPHDGFARAGASAGAGWRHDVRAVVQRQVHVALPPPMPPFARAYSLAGGLGVLQKLQAKASIMAPPWAAGLVRRPGGGPVAVRALQLGWFVPEKFVARSVAAFAAAYAPANANMPHTGVSRPARLAAANVSVAPVRKMQAGLPARDEFNKLYKPMLDKFEQALNRPRPASAVPPGHWQQRRALEDLLNHQARLPPAGDMAFNPQLSPAWAGLKIP